MLLVKMRTISKLLKGRARYGVIFATFALAAAAPFIFHGLASAEPPADNWSTGVHASWVNRGTVSWNGVNFTDVVPTDNMFVFAYKFKSNTACNNGNGSKIAWNTWSQISGVKETSPYDDGGIASQAGLQLFIPQTNSGTCLEATKGGSGDPGAASCNSYTLFTKFDKEWTGCRIDVDNVNARLYSFFKDTDGNIKSINPNQAITFVPAPNPYNGSTVYIRNDQLQAPCRNILIQVGGQWELFAFSSGGQTTWNEYYNIIKTATGAGAESRDSCAQNDNGVANTYYAQTADNIKHASDGGYPVFVGGPENAGASKAAVANAGNGSASGNSIADNTATCESSGFSLNWILCPIWNASNDFVQWMLNTVILPLLKTDDFLDPTGPIYQIWSQFRIYANIFLIIALIVIVFGQALGTSDAYTFRTFMSRLFFSVVAVNTSIYLLAAFSDIINIIQNGLGAAMTAPIKDAGLFKFTPSAGAQGGLGLTVGATAIAAATAGVFTTGIIGPGLMFVLMFAILPAIIGVITTVVILVFLRGAKDVLVPAAPIAAALYALPYTEKYARKYVTFVGEIWGAGVVLVVVFAGSDILAFLTIKRSFNDGVFTSTLELVIAFLVTFLPLAAGGWSIKIASRTLAGAHAWLSGIGKKGHEAVLGNANDANSLRNKTRRNLLNAATRGQARVVDRGRELDASPLAKLRGRVSGGLWRNLDERMASITDAETKRQNLMSATGRDQLRYAGAGWTLKAGEVAPDYVESKYAGQVATEDMHFNSKGKRISKQLLNEGKSWYGRSLQEVGAGLNYTVKKIQTDEDIANFRKSFKENVIAMGLNQQEANDLWAQATYEHKPILSSEWYSSPKVISSGGRTTDVKFDDISTGTVAGEKAYGAFMSENHKTREAFRYSSMRDSEFRAMADRQSQYTNILDSGGTLTDEQLKNLAMTNEGLDLIAKEGYASGTMTKDQDGNIQVQGPNAAANGVLTSMYKNRKYATAAYRDPSGKYSVNERVLYNRANVDAERRQHEANERVAAASKGLGYVPAQFDEWSSIEKHAIRQNPADAASPLVRVEVTGDEKRSEVKKV
jgi:hypothetical protein